MTREEKQKAIDALKKSAPVMAMTQEEFNDYIQTLNKVIDWLEQEPTAKNDLGVDAVSRKELLKIYEDRYIKLQKLKHIKGYKGAEDRQMGVNYCINILKEMPSVTPQEPKIIPIAEIKFDKDKLKELVNRAVLTITSQDPSWIPVSERLPEEDTDVLVTLKCGLIGVMQKKLADDDNGESCYIWQDFEGEEHEVIAWMPLPEPYKESEE